MAKQLMQTVSAADANRRFSEVLRGVRDGQAYTITSHGRPVARIMPFDQDNRVTAAARRVLFSRLRSQDVRQIGRWTRESLYETDR